ncbi:MAG: DUF1015 family protein [Gammaproteobacteria bacterium]|mgnify:CR=1 FL=1|nr:DUF1015 family protein [Gammaproteobacteria bacterium]
MYLAKPFKGLRPEGEEASSVSIPSTDHLSEELIKSYKENNPWSYLNIFSPNYKDTKSESEIEAGAKKRFELMKNNQVLGKDEAKSFYVYKISTGDHSQIGMIATAKVSDYDDLHIRGHEKIYVENSQKRFEQIKNLNAQIGPIYVVYPDEAALDAALKEQTAGEPTYSFDALDGYQHQLWVVNDEATVLQISELFNAVNRTYVADGHHRIAALSRFAEYRKHQNRSHTGQEPYNFFMMALFPKSQARILDYNRLIKDLFGYSSSDFIEQVEEHFVVEKQNAPFKPTALGSFGMYLDNSWYSITLKDKPEESLSGLMNLDINILHHYLLDPILDIGDPRRDTRIGFIAGFHGLEAIEKKVDSGEVEVGFSFFPTPMEHVINFADKNLTMPPKSTWFDPKPLDGLVTYDFED